MVSYWIILKDCMQCCFREAFVFVRAVSCCLSYKWTDGRRQWTRLHWTTCSFGAVQPSQQIVTCEACESPIYSLIFVNCEFSKAKDLIRLSRLTAQDCMQFSRLSSPGVKLHTIKSIRHLCSLVFPATLIKTKYLLQTNTNCNNHHGSGSSCWAS